jgi:hypothetical protein
VAEDGVLVDGERVEDELQPVSRTARAATAAVIA